MNTILRQARAARRRMTFSRFLRFLPITLLVALCVSAIGLGLAKLVYIDSDPTVWLVSWLAAPAVIALITSLCLTFVGRPTIADAATEVDRRFRLRERLSSALVAVPEDRETELGQAMLADAERKAASVDVRDQFTWGFSPKILLPVLPALVVGLLIFLPDRSAPEEVAGSKKVSLQQVKNSTDKLLEKIKTQRKKAEAKGLNAAVDMFKKLESDLADLRKDTKLDTKQAFAKLNNIKEQLEERRKELGDADALRKNLGNLRKLEPGPVDELADAMKEGDFSKAEEALEQLMEKMSNGEMSEKDMSQMQKQLDQLEKALSQAASEHEKAKQALQEQINQAEAAGDMQKASQLERKLEKMQMSDSSMAQMQQMADMLQQASQSMQEGDMQEASESLDQLMQQLSEMNASDAELQDLDELMDSLSESKSEMMQGQMGQMPGMLPGNGNGNGDGLGEGQGSGDRPEDQDDVDFYDSRQRERMRMGETVYGGKVGGANRKGVTRAEVQDAVLSSLSEEPEPLEDVPLPKMQREHTREYFNTVRDGRKE